MEKKTKSWFTVLLCANLPQLVFDINRYMEHGWLPVGSPIAVPVNNPKKIRGPNEPDTVMGFCQSLIPADLSKGPIAQPPAPEVKVPVHKLDQKRPN